MQVSVLHNQTVMMACSGKCWCRQCAVLRSSGVLLSPGSAAAEKVGASTVMVSKTDAASRPVTPEQKTRPGSAAASQGEEWQIL